MAWGVDPMDRSKNVDNLPYASRHSLGPLEGCAEEGLRAWQPSLLSATKSFCTYSLSVEPDTELTLNQNELHSFIFMRLQWKYESSHTLA